MLESHILSRREHRVWLLGVVYVTYALQVNQTETGFAKHSLFVRHPEMKTWPSSHNWFFAKLNITNIWVLDYFGGPKIVTPEEYYNVTFQ